MRGHRGDIRGTLGGNWGDRHPVVTLWGTQGTGGASRGHVGDRRCCAFLTALVILNHYLAFQFFAEEYFLFSEVSGRVGTEWGQSGTEWDRVGQSGDRVGHWGPCRGCGTLGGDTNEVLRGTRKSPGWHWVPKVTLGSPGDSEALEVTPKSSR